MPRRTKRQQHGGFTYSDCHGNTRTTKTNHTRQELNVLGQEFAGHTGGLRKRRSRRKALKSQSRWGGSRWGGSRRRSRRSRRRGGMTMDEYNQQKKAILDDTKVKINSLQSELEKELAEVDKQYNTTSIDFNDWDGLRTQTDAC